MSAADTKRCVFCGGDDHPAECGLPTGVTPMPWIGLALAAAIPVYLLVALVVWLV